MEFFHFKELASKLKKIPLVGDEAHKEMIPYTRKTRPSIAEITKRAPLDAGVMALFYPNAENETSFMLILRKASHSVHSGQMGLPGGRVELKDKDLGDTALRETYEEIGVRPSSILIPIKALSRIYIPPSNFWVYPFIGVAKSTLQFRRQKSEVEELVPVKLEDLLDDNNLVEVNRITENKEKIPIPAFSLNNKIVWGATAMMLNEVKYLLHKIL